jgi:hypothetical protein
VIVYDYHTKRGYDMEQHAFLFQSRADPSRLFLAVCADYELAYFRASAAIGHDIAYYGRLNTIENQCRLVGGKMELREIRVKS